MEKKRVSRVRKVITEKQFTIDKIREIIADRLDVKFDEVLPEASFADDLGADSLDQVELIMAMEEEFNLSIKDEDVEKLLTVRKVIEYISDHT
ncbi:MAG: acyl carrier protein [Patescibacteria group bacterium]|nr:acyl carrier protein [Patescibacteria group bacterium]